VHCDFDPVVSSDDYLEQLAHAKRCPVVHSNMDGGFWVVSTFKESMKVLTDWKTFVSPSRIPAHFTFGNAMPPIDYNPPVQQDFRALLNPFFTPAYVARYRSRIKEIAEELIDRFIDAGCCEFSGAFSRPMAAQITFELIFGIEDPAEREQNRQWTDDMVYGFVRLSPEERMAVEQKWSAWIEEFVARRQREPRRGDALDSLIHGTVEGGRSVTNDEIVGAVKILTLGGFGTTADTTANLIIQLCDQPDLQPRLRGDSEAIAGAIEEIIRLAPPIAGMSRTCARETELDGNKIAPDDRVLLLFANANRDPDRFASPEEFDITRSVSHISFSGGAHRCLGSNLARLALEIIFETILDRMGDIRLASDDAVRRATAPGTWYVPYHVPIEFEKRDHVGG
jgi:cytochrome P450